MEDPLKLLPALLAVVVAIGLVALFVTSGRSGSRNKARQADQRAEAIPWSELDLSASLERVGKTIVSMETEGRSIEERRTWTRQRMLTLMQREETPGVAVRAALGHAQPNVVWAGLLFFEYYGPADSFAAERIVTALRPNASLPLKFAAAKASSRVAPGEDFRQVAKALRELVASMEGAPTDEQIKHDIRRAAVATLSERAVEDTSALKWFVPLLRDDDPKIREHAAFGFSQFEFHERFPKRDVLTYLPVLRMALRDVQAPVRTYALMSLGRMGKLAAPALEDMADLVDDSDVLVRRTCLTALGGVGAPAIPTLKKGLDTCGDEQVASFAHALYMIGDDAVSTLNEAMHHKRSIVRVVAATKLWERTRNPAKAIDVLVSVLKDENAPDQSLAVLQAARALGRIGTDAKAALPSLNACADQVRAESERTQSPGQDQRAQRRIQVIRALESAIRVIDR